MLPAKAVPDLVDRAGHFRTDMARAGAAMFFCPRCAPNWRRRSQLSSRRLPRPAFGWIVNAHKHFHLHPTIASLIVKSEGPWREGRAGPLEPQAVLEGSSRTKLRLSWL